MQFYIPEVVAVEQVNIDVFIVYLYYETVFFKVSMLCSRYWVVTQFLERNVL